MRALLVEWVGRGDGVVVRQEGDGALRARQGAMETAIGQALLVSRDGARRRRADDMLAINLLDDRLPGPSEGQALEEGDEQRTGERDREREGDENKRTVKKDCGK